jgi:hypothetical protein
MAGGENTIAGHFVCLEHLILLVVGRRKHTISIYMYVRSDGKVNREEKPSSRHFCWSRMTRAW